MNIADNHIEAIKAEFRKQKEIDPDGHVNDWVALLHYQSLNGDGLYATINQLQTIVAVNIETYVEKLLDDEVGRLTFDAYHRSERLRMMDYWETHEADDAIVGLISNDAVQIYLNELLWQKIDEESYEMEEEEEKEDLDDLSTSEVFEKLEGELYDAINSSNLDVKLLALEIQRYVDRLKELVDE